MSLNRQSGFTLLELLVVIAILAGLGGLLLVAYEGLESQAAKGAATNTIASVTNSVRAYTVNQRRAPNNLDTMLAASFGNPGDGSEQPLAILGSKIAGKMTPAAITADQADALVSAGITDVRYIDTNGNTEVGGALAVPAADGSVASVGPISRIDIPNRVFDVPRPGSGRNRGRGFAAALAAGFPLMIWNPGAGGINLTKLGASAAGSENLGTGNPDDDDVLVALGLGNESSIVSLGDSATLGDITLANAPYYTDVGPSEYSRYILLYNLGSVNNPRSEAKLQAVIDARGDFLDEEFAEYTGQKQ
ncbi:MAG: prepilin-type N-terminal cleavage/methylation domain-containing protein [Planctomycetes bacterium]|nr:prepilin-type N-terminal cleavage/methylation domain-containing protein [Planctomycetota bacterium]